MSHFSLTWLQYFYALFGNIFNCANRILKQLLRSCKQGMFFENLKSVLKNSSTIQVLLECVLEHDLYQILLVYAFIFMHYAYHAQYGVCNCRQNSDWGRTLPHTIVRVHFRFLFLSALWNCEMNCYNMYLLTFTKVWIKFCS